jgi:hypothetical protein
MLAEEQGELACGPPRTPGRDGWPSLETLAAPCWPNVVPKSHGTEHFPATPFVSLNTRREAVTPTCPGQHAERQHTGVPELITKGKLGMELIGEKLPEIGLIFESSPRTILLRGEHLAEARVRLRARWERG